MSLADQINQIRKLAAQGKTESEIAATVGVEMGDVATVLAGTAAGGPSSSSLRRTIACPFAYNTPNLRTGATVYTPTIGDILHDAWIEIDTVWDGTTPLADIGQLSSAVVDGWFNDAWGDFVDLTIADDNATTGDGLLMQRASPRSSREASSLALAFAMSDTTFPNRWLPAQFVTADPIKLWVTTTGGIPAHPFHPGSDPGSTQGAAVLYLDISTPQSA